MISPCSRLLVSLGGGTSKPLASQESEIQKAMCYLVGLHELIYGLKERDEGDGLLAHTGCGEALRRKERGSCSYSIFEVRANEDLVYGRNIQDILSFW